MENRMCKRAFTLPYRNSPGSDVKDAHESRLSPGREPVADVQVEIQRQVHRPEKRRQDGGDVQRALDLAWSAGAGAFWEPDTDIVSDSG